MKKFNGRKFGTILTIAIVGALIVTTLVMAFVPKNFQMNIKAPDSIQVLKDGKENLYNNDTDNTASKKVYDNILKDFDKSFEQSYLKALFNGNIKQKATIGYVPERTVSVSSGRFLKFYYNEEQTLMDGNKAYKVNDQPIKYNQLIVQIAEGDDELVSITVYILVLDRTNRYKYSYTTLANFTQLIEYIDTLTLT